jgi:hypothetical protein
MRRDSGLVARRGAIGDAHQRVADIDSDAGCAANLASDAYFRPTRGPRRDSSATPSSRSRLKNHRIGCGDDLIHVSFGGFLRGDERIAIRRKRAVRILCSDAVG